MNDTNASNDRGGTAETEYREFRFDCPYCDDAMQSTEAEAVKDRGHGHLEGHHDDELPSVFAETYGGEPCHNNCGYAFPVGVEEVSGLQSTEFECPDCGFDNFSAFLRQYLYWQIEIV